MFSGEQLREAVSALQEAIGALVAERQALRACGASPGELEANRLEIVRRQRQLSYATIGSHLVSLPDDCAVPAAHHRSRLHPLAGAVKR
jgi:hypothetical protein